MSLLLLLAFTALVSSTNLGDTCTNHCNMPFVCCNGICKQVAVPLEGTCDDTLKICAGGPYQCSYSGNTATACCSGKCREINQGVGETCDAYHICAGAGSGNPCVPTPGLFCTSGKCQNPAPPGGNPGGNPGGGNPGQSMGGNPGQSMGGNPGGGNPGQSGGNPGQSMGGNPGMGNGPPSGGNGWSAGWSGRR